MHPIDQFTPQEPILFKPTDLLNPTILLNQAMSYLRAYRRYIVSMRVVGYQSYCR